MAKYLKIIQSSGHTGRHRDREKAGVEDQFDGLEFNGFKQSWQLQT